MSEVSGELIELLLHLFPGFLAAWVLYGLTSYPKPSQFERVIQALVFSFLIRAVLPLEEQLALYAGAWIDLGLWDDDAELLSAAITGISFGLAGSYFANNDKLYALARRLGLEGLCPRVVIKTPLICSPVACGKAVATAQMRIPES